MAALQAEFEESGKLPTFERFKVYAFGQKSALPYLEMAQELGMREGAVRVDRTMAASSQGRDPVRRGDGEEGRQLEAHVLRASRLAGQQTRGSVAIVGHEPDLGRLVCALLASTNGPFLELRKGAACLLEFPGAVARGAATLDWFLGPKYLRRLGERA